MQLKLYADGLVFQKQITGHLFKIGGWMLLDLDVALGVGHMIHENAEKPISQEGVVEKMSGTDGAHFFFLINT